ncbi:hypothetical protein CR513_21243, partial [Mucuna pruriens]
MKRKGLCTTRLGAIETQLEEESWNDEDISRFVEDVLVVKDEKRNGKVCSCMPHLLKDQDRTSKTERTTTNDEDT